MTATAFPRVEDPAATLPSAPDDVDLLVHALAQLPEEVVLEVACAPEDRRRLALVAAAYGIEERLRLEDAPGSARDWTMSVREAGGGLRPVAARGGGRPVRSMAELVAAVWPAGAPAPAADRGVPLDGEHVVLVTNVPARYRVPLFRGVAARLAREGARLTVVFLAHAARGRAWLDTPASLDFDHAFLHGLPLPVRRRPPFVPLDLGRRLRALEPTIAIAAGFSPLVAGATARFAARREIPFGLFSGEIAGTATARSRWRTRQRVGIASRADFALAYGSLSASYLRELAPTLPVVIARNTSVAHAWAHPPSRAATAELLTVGDLSSPRKGIDVAIDALRLAPDLSCRLTVVGGGAQRGLLERRAAGDPRIRFVGPLAGDRLERRYAESDVFLFPSRSDVFGLALVEAMAAGLPSVVSSAPGAVADLAVDGGNSLVVDCHDPAAWAAAIRRVVEDADLRRELAASAARTIAKRWTLDHAVEATVAGIRLGALVGGKA